MEMKVSNEVNPNIYWLIPDIYSADKKVLLLHP